MLKRLQKLMCYIFCLLFYNLFLYYIMPSRFFSPTTNFFKSFSYYRPSLLTYHNFSVSLHRSILSTKNNIEIHLIFLIRFRKTKGIIATSAPGLIFITFKNLMDANKAYNRLVSYPDLPVP